MNFDEKASITIYNFVKARPMLYKLHHFVCKASYYLYMPIYILFIITLFFSHNGLFLKYMMIPFLLLGANIGLRKTVKRKRPLIAFGLEGMAEEKESYCFPSNHCASSAVIALSTFYVCPTAGIILLVCAFVSGVVRVGAGFHYPLDVLAGWSMGLLFAYIGFGLC